MCLLLVARGASLHGDTSAGCCIAQATSIVKPTTCSAVGKCLLGTHNKANTRGCMFMIPLSVGLCVASCSQGSKVVLHPGDCQDPDVASDIMLLPDTETLADRPKPCLAEVASLPRDWARLFDGQLFCIGRSTAARDNLIWQTSCVQDTA